MPGDTTFTFLDATSVTKTAHAGSDVGGNLAPSAVLYDVNGNVLVGQDARAASLPVALSTEDAALLADLLTNTAFQARIPANGQAAMAGSLPVVIASNQTAIATTVASLPLPSGAATEATLSALNTKIPASPSTDRTTAAGPFATRLSDGAAFYKATTPSDTQPISGTVTANIGTAGTLATAANQTTGNASLSSIDTKTPALGQALAAGSTPVVLTAAQLATLTPPAAITGFLTEADFDIKVGSLTETAPGTDTASSGLNGRLQRIAQRLTSLIAALGSPFQAGGSIGNTTFGATQSGTWNITNVSGTVSLPTGAATEATLATRLTESDFDTKIGSLTETAPGTDTASSGLNGRLQRIAQRLTSMIALMPASLGQKTMANSYAVTIASDQTAVPASQSGTWTVQPGNTANTTAWLVKDIRAATGTTTSVNDTASNTTLLASNSSRLGATIYNESTQILYVKLGATASLTSYAVQMAPGGYYELPFDYTGIVDGIWAADAAGAARIVEMT